MPDFLFTDHDGKQFVIRGTEVNKVEITLGEGALRQYGPHCMVTVFQTENNGYKAVVEYDPGAGNQKIGTAWTGIIPDARRPKAESIEALMLELETARHVGAFPHAGVEQGVQEAVKAMSPEKGPTVID
jgi:hypothetical protein